MFTKRQKQILDFITIFSKKHGFAPTFAEIKKRMKLRSLATIHQHILALEKKGYLERTKGQARSMVASVVEKMIQVPLLGRIAAGQPIEAIEDKETIAVPQSKLPFSQGNYYALRVAGDSMVDEHINDGDIVLVKEQKTAENGQKVVALLNNSEATLKTFYKEKNRVRLQPANQNYAPIFVDRKTPLAIQGVVCEVIKSAQEETRLCTILPLNQIIVGDAIEEMKKIPSDSIDMTFADPPFNLNKKYGNYKDKKTINDYIEWCEKWLTEMVRITKPTGSILVHNIPRWLTYYANHLNKIAIFKHWIAWDAMSNPLGKTLLPAHYGILFYTKIQKGFKFHELRAQHKKCRKCGEMIKDYGGKKKQINPYGTLLSDVWTDIHRIRHNTRRDEHPCQLPEPLLERLILMTTDEGDVILDPFIGAGTTALSAKRLGRNYIGIDIDSKYKKIIMDKLKKVQYRSSNGYKYNDEKPVTTSKYLKNLTLSEDEGIYPVDNPQNLSSIFPTKYPALAL